MDVVLQSRTPKYGIWRIHPKTAAGHGCIALLLLGTVKNGGITLAALTASLLPLDVAGEAGRVLFEAVVRFLSEWGGELSFEEIDAVAGALSDFGVDAAVAAHAHQHALQKRTSDL